MADQPVLVCREAFVEIAPARVIRLMISSWMWKVKFDLERLDQVKQGQVTHLPAHVFFSESNVTFRYL